MTPCTVLEEEQSCWVAGWVLASKLGLEEEGPTRYKGGHNMRLPPLLLERAGRRSIEELLGERAGQGSIEETLGEKVGRGT
jgi:hypothetical protein